MKKLLSTIIFACSIADTNIESSLVRSIPDSSTLVQSSAITDPIMQQYLEMGARDFVILAGDIFASYIASQAFTTNNAALDMNDIKAKYEESKQYLNMLTYLDGANLKLEQAISTLSELRGSTAFIQFEASLKTSSVKKAQQAYRQTIKNKLPKQLASMLTDQARDNLALFLVRSFPVVSMDEMSTILMDILNVINIVPAMSLNSKEIKLAAKTMKDAFNVLPILNQSFEIMQNLMRNGVQQELKVQDKLANSSSVARAIAIFMTPIFEFTNPVQATKNNAIFTIFNEIRKYMEQQPAYGTPSFDIDKQAAGIVDHLRQNQATQRALKTLSIKNINGFFTQLQEQLKGLFSLNNQTLLLDSLQTELLSLN